jgi:signal transduction histidine kinase
VHEPLGKIIFSRWVIGCILLCIPLLNQVFSLTDRLLAPENVLSISLYHGSLNVVITIATYIAVMRGYRWAVHLGSLHIFIDIVGITALVYFTGAADSPLFTLYIFPILFSMILYFDRRVFIVVCSTIIAYIGIVYVDAYAFLPHIDRTIAYSKVYGDIGATTLRVITVCFQAVGILFVAWMIRRMMNDRERRITREKRYMKTLVEAIPQGLVMVDARFRIVMMNDIARQHLSLNDADRRQTILSASPAAGCEELHAVLRSQPLEPAVDKEVHLGCGNKDNHLIVNTIPIVDKKAYPRLWLHILQDVTEQNAFDQLKSDFVSIAAHQLRTPLSGLKWFFDQFIEDTADQITVEQMSQLVSAQEQNEKIIRMVNDLLHISEIEAKETTMQLKPISVRDLIGTAVHSINKRAAEGDVTIDVDDFDGEVRGDWRQLHILFSNLIENAIKYSPEGTRVSVTAERIDDRVRFTVEDAGMGIPKADHERIFMKFFRTRDAQRMEGSGSGLGLYIVRKIAKAHGGRIVVDSVEGEGTTFTIDIPT